MHLHPFISTLELNISTKDGIGCSIRVIGFDINQTYLSQALRLWQLNFICNNVYIMRIDFC